MVMATAAPVVACICRCSPSSPCRSCTRSNRTQNRRHRTLRLRCADTCLCSRSEAAGAVDESPPSSHSPSSLKAHALLQQIPGGGLGGGGTFGGGGHAGGRFRLCDCGGLQRSPQSAQSVPYGQLVNSPPGPPSSQSPSPAYSQSCSQHPASLPETG
eukprot:7381488-Prymnesium_polylepis.2